MYTKRFIALCIIASLPFSKMSTEIILQFGPKQAKKFGQVNALRDVHLLDYNMASEGY